MNPKIKMFVFLVVLGFASSMFFSALPWDHYMSCFENGMVPDLSSKEKRCIEIITPRAFGEMHYPPPLKQVKSGVAPDRISCKDNLVLIQRHDESPACVRPETKQKLIERGWTVKESVHSSPFGSSEENHSNLDPVYNENPNNPEELILDLDAMIKKHDSGFEVPVYSSFANGVTQIINPEFEHLKYRVTSPVIDETYLSKSIQQWNDATQYELEAEYEKYGDDFYLQLGKLLIKNEMQHQMDNLGMVNANDDFEVYSGMVLQSLPPHISFSAVIYATDGNYYRLEGTTHANKVSYYSTTQLRFPDTGEKLPIESILDKPQLITILPKDGNKARQEPSTLVIHINDNAVEFFNNTPKTIRIQDSGSGVIGEENTLDWMGPTILPYQNATMTFDNPGLIRWDARNAPSLEEPFWWSTHAGGNIVVLSDDMNNFSREDKARIAQVILHNSDIPLATSGSGNAEQVLMLWLDPAVTEMVPNAQEYYLQRAKQLVPFDVEIVMYG